MLWSLTLDSRGCILQEQQSKNGNAAAVPAHLTASTVLGRLQAKFLNLQTPVGMRLHSSFSHREARRRIRYGLPNPTRDV